MNVEREAAASSGARLVYLDWNATTPPHPSVLAAMARAAGEVWANSSSVHRFGQRARAALDGAREAVAALLGFSAHDVVLTSGGTEANNLALLGFFAPGAGGALVVSGVEHPSVLRAAEALGRRGVALSVVAPDASGRVDPAAVAEALARLPPALMPRLVSLQVVNHETGVIQPVPKVAELAHAHGASLHADAVQAAGKLAADAWLGADVVSLAAHKIRGPKGIGALGFRRGVKLAAVAAGGAQEQGLRPGTLDALAAVGLRAACARAAEHRRATEAVRSLRDDLEAGVLLLAQRHGSAVERNGSAERMPHVSNLSFDGWRGAELCAALDLEGIAASSGAACSAGTPEPSAVIRAMLGAERAARAVRLSLGEGTTREDIAHALAAFDRVLARGPAR